ncbi:hypothetical protein EPUL_003916 [Erysiphe pulchra]|uniref:Uncharacterized protein n=1 Tax=Erysiphe pulchra TaxID=225359 RepID=A0A2S4PT97_9PEZI|nr:hypothetical protein EPUL_003916 [Erysiphe pulchra]
MTAAVSMIGDLARNVAAGQNLINNLRPEPPKVQFYNIRLGLGSGLNSSGSLPSVIATDIANTQFFTKFEEVSSVLTKPRRSYQDISINFLGTRGKRTDNSEAGEVAVQTTPPSNGFSLKSVDLQGGSESLCISNIVIKGSNSQSPRGEIFIPIGDLGFFVDENGIGAQFLTNSISAELLHLDIERMAKIFNVDKNDELKRTDLSTACTYLSNSREIDVLNGRYSGSTSINSEFEDNIEEVMLQQAVSDLYNENKYKDQSRSEDIIVGEMRTEDLFSKKQVAVDQQDISDNFGPEMTPDNSILDEEILEVEEAFADQQFQINKEISEEILEEAENQAEDSLLVQQALEEESLLEDEIIAETLLEQQAENFSPEEMLEMKLNLVETEVEAEEELAEKSLVEEELLAEEELMAEENLAHEILSDEERMAEERLIAEEVQAEVRLAETFTKDTPTEERLEAETELLKAEMAAEEDLLARERFEEEQLGEEMLRAEQELMEDEMFAEEELEEEEMNQREELSDQITNEQVLTDPSYSYQQSQENVREWLEGQEISGENIDDDFFLQGMTEEEFANLPNLSEMMVDEIYDDDIYQENAQDWLDEQELISEKLNNEQSFAKQLTGEKPDFLTTDKVIKEDQTNAEGVGGRSELKKRQTFIV